MTKLVLDSPRPEAEAMVVRAIENTPSFRSYERRDDVIVASSPGGITSLGEEVRIAFDDESDRGQTVVDVFATRSSVFNVASNPWKRKSELIVELKELRDESDADFDPLPQETRGESGEESDVEVSDADMLFLASRLLFYIFAGSVVLVAIAVGVILLL